MALEKPRKTSRAPYSLPDYLLVNRTFRVVLRRRLPEKPIGEINAIGNDLLRALYKLARYVPPAPRGRQPLPRRDLRERFRALQLELNKRYVHRTWVDGTDQYLRGKWWPDRVNVDSFALDYPELIRDADYPAEILKSKGGPYKLACILMCARYRITPRSLDKITRKK